MFLYLVFLVQDYFFNSSLLKISLIYLKLRNLKHLSIKIGNYSSYNNSMTVLDDESHECLFFVPKVKQHLDSEDGFASIS